MNQHLVAVFLAIYAGCALLGILPAAALAATNGQLILAALALALGLFTATVLASGVADLW